MFKLPQGRYQTPILVSSTDGVGTKLKSAKDCGKFELLGVDLVAMNVNDIVTCGAKPLFFLDYFAVGKLNLNFMKDVVKGIAAGCEEAECSLIGGETAEMPGLYRGGDFDLAGFAVGVVEEDKMIDGSTVAADDVVIGCASSGLHSNGFSFVRRVFKKAFIKEHANEILKPTHIYVKPVLELIKKVPVKAMAHITGGGFYDNIPRVLPKGLGASIDAESWKIPAVFRWLHEKSKTTFKEMYRTFNMGIGFVIVVSPKDALKTINLLSKAGVQSWAIGKIVRGEGVSIQ